MFNIKETELCTFEFIMLFVDDVFDDLVMMRCCVWEGVMMYFSFENRENSESSNNVTLCC